MMKLIIPALIILGLAVFAMAIRVIFIKGGRFRKSCSSVDLNGKSLGQCECDSSSKEKHEACKNYKNHHPENI